MIFRPRVCGDRGIFGLAFRFERGLFDVNVLGRLLDTDQPFRPLEPRLPGHGRKTSILVVDDEPAVLALISHQLASEFEVTTSPNAENAKQLCGKRVFDVVMTDLHLPDASGMHLLDWINRNSPTSARILVTGTARLQDAADAINCCRVHRLILKPWRSEDLVNHLRDVEKAQQLERNHEQLLTDMRALNAELEQRVQERTQDLKVMNQILGKMALTDPLTGLPNRRAIDIVARKEMLRRSRVNAPIALGLVDADRFKQINTQHLLSGGDHVLAHLGKILQRSVRATDSVGRVGGEEFLVIAPETDLEGARILGERLRCAVEDSSIEFHGQPIRLTISIGFATADADRPCTYEQLRELAAANLSVAKSGGRNRCVSKAMAGESCSTN
jgi:diguanylate cyclase (GGDEF)-like protein